MERAGCEKISGPIPPDIVQRLELVCNLGNSSGYYRVVLVAISPKLWVRILSTLTKAIKKTDRQRAAVIMPNLAPCGYSGSSSSLSRASALSSGDTSTTLFSRSCELLLRSDGLRDERRGRSFSSWDVDVFSLGVGLTTLSASFPAVEGTKFEKGSFIVN